MAPSLFSWQARFCSAAGVAKARFGACCLRNDTVCNVWRVVFRLPFWTFLFSLKLYYVLHSFRAAVPRGTRINMVWRTLAAPGLCTTPCPARSGPALGASSGPTGATPRHSGRPKRRRRRSKHTSFFYFAGMRSALGVAGRRQGTASLPNMADDKTKHVFFVFVRAPRRRWSKLILFLLVFM